METFSQPGISSPTSHGYKNKVKESPLNIEIPNIKNEFYQCKNYMAIMENETDNFVKPIGLTKLINLSPTSFLYGYYTPKVKKLKT